jgi:hypothetical protein
MLHALCDMVPANVLIFKRFRLAPGRSMQHEMQHGANLRPRRHLRATTRCRLFFCAALAKHDAALAAEEAFDCSVCAAANGAAAKVKARIPHAVVNVRVREISTEDWREVAQHRSRLEGVRYLEACAWEDHRQSIALVDAADARLAAVSALPEVIHAEAMTDRSDALWTERCRLRDAAIEAPAENLAELARKFALMDDGEDGAQEKYLPAFRADLEQLAKGALA